MNSLRDFFKKIQNEDYVILRNFEDINDSYASSLHPDIDILCADYKRFKSVSGVSPRTPFDDTMHYKLSIGSDNIPIDLRHIGDGYLCKAFETDILKCKKPYTTKDGITFFVPDDSHLYYSLLYHALIQKKTLSEDYRQKLSISDDRIANIHLLEAYMLENNYTYSYPFNPKGILNLKFTNPALLEHNPLRKILRKLWS